MTLILSLLTNEYVLQVSDTRLTLRDGSVADDDATKAVFWYRGMSFGYSGEAELQRSTRVHREREPWLGRQPTYMWIAEVLVGAPNVEEVIRRLCLDGDEAIDRTGEPRACKPHSFIGVGWTPVVGTDDVEPLFLEVSNTTPPYFFVPTRQGLQPDGMFRHSSQGADRVQEFAHLSPEMSPEESGRIMVSALRRLADEDVDGAIGKNVLETCIPRSQAMSVIAASELHLVDGPPSTNYASFRYLQGPTEAQPRTPSFVLGGNVSDQFNLGGAVTLTFGENSVTFRVGGRDAAPGG